MAVFIIRMKYLSHNYLYVSNSKPACSIQFFLEKFLKFKKYEIQKRSRHLKSMKKILQSIFES